MAVYNANNLDIEAVKKNGSVELYIVSSGKFDDSPEQQTLLMDKIENYIGYVLSEEFKTKHPNCPIDNCCIVLSLDKKPSSLLLELCAKIRSWIKSYGICFRAEYNTLLGKKRSVDL